MAHAADTTLVLLFIQICTGTGTKMMDGDIMRCYFNLKYVNCTPDWLLMMMVTGHECCLSITNNDNDGDQMTIFWMFCTCSYPDDGFKYHPDSPYVLCRIYVFFISIKVHSSV